MAVNLSPPEGLLSIAGCRVGTAKAGIRKAGRSDLVVMDLAEGSRCSGVFTRNAFAAAPVLLCRERLASGVPIRGLLINAGNANAATGRGGLADARELTAAVANALGAPEASVLPFSTGVIGERLPVPRMLQAVPQAVSALSEDGWLSAAQAIMTTDTVAKGVSRTVATSQGTVTVTGIAKGVGMICPDMATLLAFVATDARLEAVALTQCHVAAVRDSFNSVSVDGDTSTNDACMLVATGQVGTKDVGTAHADYAAIAETIHAVCVDLAQRIVRDGEGATRFVTLDIGGARSRDEARLVGYAIAHSPLVKTALNAGDANWGRLIMAIGKAGLEDLDPAGVSVALDDVVLLRQGEPHPDYREVDGTAVLAKAEFCIAVNLGRGQAEARMWTCDLSHEYIKINAEYRT